MDLIYTNAQREDLGVLQRYTLDMAIGADENDFACTIPAAGHCCTAGSLLYVDETEYGGIVDAVQSKGAAGEVIYHGRTWHGILNSKILQPGAGEDYLTVSGEANAVLTELLGLLALEDLFTASDENSGIVISGYRFPRYAKAYDAIRDMLASCGAKLLFRWRQGFVLLQAAPITDHSLDAEFDSDQVTLDVTRRERTVNHLICLGKGELADRTVLHLYADAAGAVSNTQSFFGVDEFCDVYDYASVESEEDLLTKGTERLQALWQPVALQVSFDDLTGVYDLGDLVGAVDNVTGVSVTAKIVKKIVTIKNGTTLIEYKVGV